MKDNQRELLEIMGQIQIIRERITNAIKAGKAQSGIDAYKEGLNALQERLVKAKQKPRTAKCPKVSTVAFQPDGDFTRMVYADSLGMKRTTRAFKSKVIAQNKGRTEEVSIIGFDGLVAKGLVGVENADFEQYSIPAKKLQSLDGKTRFHESMLKRIRNWDRSDTDRILNIPRLLGQYDSRPWNNELRKMLNGCWVNELTDPYMDARDEFGVATYEYLKEAIKSILETMVMAQCAGDVGAARSLMEAHTTQYEDVMAKLPNKGGYYDLPHFKVAKDYVVNNEKWEDAIRFTDVEDGVLEHLGKVVPHRGTTPSQPLKGQRHDATNVVTFVKMGLVDTFLFVGHTGGFSSFENSFDAITMNEKRKFGNAIRHAHHLISSGQFNRKTYMDEIVYRESMDVLPWMEVEVDSLTLSMSRMGQFNVHISPLKPRYVTGWSDTAAEAKSVAYERITEAIEGRSEEGA